MEPSVGPRFYSTLASVSWFPLPQPTPSIKVLRLIFGGLIPVKTIWELTPAKVGGHDAYINCCIKMFMPDENELPRPLEAIRDALLKCSSIDSAHTMLSERESRVRR